MPLDAWMVVLVDLLLATFFVGHAQSCDERSPSMHRAERCRSTTTHLFLLSEHLGSGASCEVYRGVQRDTGRVHALKILKDAGWAQSLEHRREVDTLQKLKHKNILVFVGHEQEVGTGRTVLVMEYCNGGSLLSFLQEPHNHRGLHDDDLLGFLRDISSGLQYLRENRVVHRDLKPGNILRHIASDGRAVYKISDFGASRTLDLGQEEFMSLAGTEEYLHPELYKRAFVDRHSKQAFHGEEVDLWSLGCTIYHACAAEVPFKPFGGPRSNRGTMYQMIAQKPEGVISGVQPSLDSQIVWGRDIPPTCNLSQDLHAPMRSLIGGLVTVGRSQWKFSAYLTSVQRLLALRRYALVNTETASVHKLYLSPQAGFAELQERVAMVTEIPATEQLLFSRDDLPLPSNSPLPPPAVPLLLVSRALTQLGEYGSLKFNIEAYPAFGVSSLLEDDVRVALQDCVFLEHVRARVSHVDSLLTQLPFACSCLRRFLAESLQRLEKQERLQMRSVEESHARLDQLREQEKIQTDLRHVRNPDLTSRLRAAKRLTVEIRKQIQPCHEQLCALTKAWKDVTDIEDDSLSAEDAGEDSRTDRLRRLVERATAVNDRMKSRKRCHDLSDMDRVEHIHDKKYLQELCASAVHIWQSECEPRLRRLHDDFLHRKGNLVAMLGRLQTVEMTLHAMKGRQEELAVMLAAVSAFLGRDWKHTTEQIDVLFRISGEQRPRNILFKQHEETRKRLEDLLLDLPDVELLPDVDVGGTSVLNTDRRKGRCRDRTHST